MDPQFKTSFIPKKPIVSQSANFHAPSTINLFSLLATVLFIVTVVLSGGAFFYKGYLTNQIDSKKSTLERARGAFDPEVIDQIIRLDTRIESSKKLLSSHLAITPFFNFLSSVTLRTVRFKDFSFAYLAKDKINVEMKGEAESYASIALQSDLLNSQKNLTDTIISDVALESSGTISFKINTNVGSSLVSYLVDLSKNVTTDIKTIEKTVELVATTTNP